jgi:hypothetical protein
MPGSGPPDCVQAMIVHPEQRRCDGVAEYALDIDMKISSIPTTSR